MSAPPPRRHALIAGLGLPLRLLLVSMAVLELGCMRLFHLLLRPRFRIEGRCRGNAVCCHHLLFVDGALLRWRPLRWLSAIWLQQVHAFCPTANGVEMPDGRWARIYRCGWLSASGRCRQHWLRPMMCRRYPRPAYFEAPVLHRGCGYRVVDRSSGQVVSPQPLDDAQVAQDVSTASLVQSFVGRR